MKILSFGEILWDVYPQEKYIGGAPLNFAANMAMHGESVYMASAVGNDELGKDAIKQLLKWNISTENVAINDYPTGKCIVSIDNGIPKYELLKDVAFDYIPYSHINEFFDVIYFGTLALRSEYNYRTLSLLLTRNNYSDIFVDINIRPPFYTVESINFAIRTATILKISLEELPMVANSVNIDFSGNYKEFSQSLSKKYPNLKIIIITLGEKGAFAMDCIEKSTYECDCKKVKVISTVGAGDSFSAAFLHKYLKGGTIQICLQYASKIAEFVVSKFDAVPTYSPKDF